MKVFTVSDAPERELFPGYRARLIHSDRMTRACVTRSRAGATGAMVLMPLGIRRRLWSVP